MKVRRRGRIKWSVAYNAAGAGSLFLGPVDADLGVFAELVAKITNAAAPKYGRRDGTDVYNEMMRHLIAGGPTYQFPDWPHDEAQTIAWFDRHKIEVSAAKSAGRKPIRLPSKQTPA